MQFRYEMSSLSFGGISGIFVVFILCCVGKAASKGPGSNEWGSWEETPDGILPAVRYLGRSNESQSGSLLHQFGNDRLVAVCAADGLISIRQDEGGPKLLHGFDSSLRQFRGGAGWLSMGGQIIASSRCPTASQDGGACKNLDIRFGVGQASKTTAVGQANALSHAVQAPFGDLPFLISEVNASTATGEAEGSSYTEVWSTLAQELLPGGWNTAASRYWTHNVSALCLTKDEVKQNSSGEASYRVVQANIEALGRRGTAPTPPCPPSSQALMLFDHIDNPAAARTSFRGTLTTESAASSDFDKSDSLDSWPTSFPSPSLHDRHPRPVFLALLAPPGGQGTDFAGCSVSSNGTAVFPDPERPDAPAVSEALDGSVGATAGVSTVLAIQTPTAQFASPELSIIDSIPRAGQGRPRSNPDGGVDAMYLVSGYVPPGHVETPEGAASLLAPVLAARSSAGGVRAWLAASSRRFASTGIRFEPDPETEAEASQWAHREQVWQAGYTRGAMSYDDFWQGFLINQAGVYQYSNGFQGAIRDPLGHVAPLVFNARFDPGQNGRSAVSHTGGSPQSLEFPESALGRGSTMEMVRFSVEQADAAWTMPWGVQAFGQVYSENYTSPVGRQMHPSDLEIWTLGAAARYVLATRDAAPLFQNVSRNVSSHGEPGPAGVPPARARVPLHEALWALYQRLVQVIGTGPHGLLKMLHMDHNDGICHSIGLSGDQCKALETQGETVMNTAMAGYMLPQFADSLRVAAEYKGSACAQQPQQLLCTRASEIKIFAKQLVAAMNKAAINTAVVGSEPVPLYYRRAWISPVDGWVGCSTGSCPPGIRSNDSAVWLEPNAWALLAGGPESINGPPNRQEEFASSVFRSIQAGLRDPSPIGTHFANQTYEAWGGAGHYSNVWPCGIMPYVEALGARGYSDTAWDEVKRNAFATHSEVYPSILAGTWTGSDNYIRPGHSTAGQGGVQDWQLHNMWSHAASQLRLPSLVGAVFGFDNLQVSARFLNQSTWSFSSPLLNVSRRVSSCRDDDRTVDTTMACVTGSWAPRTVGDCPSITLLLRDPEPKSVRQVMVNGEVAKWSALPPGKGLPARIDIQCPAWAASGSRGLVWSVEVASA